MAEGLVLVPVLAVVWFMAATAAAWPTPIAGGGDGCALTAALAAGAEVYRIGDALLVNWGLTGGCSLPGTYCPINDPSSVNCPAVKIGHKH